MVSCNFECDGQKCGDEKADGIRESLVRMTRGGNEDIETRSLKF